VHKFAAKDFLEEVFEKELVTPVIVVQPFMSRIFHRCLPWVFLTEPGTAALNRLLCWSYCYTNAQFLIPEMDRNQHREENSEFLLCSLRSSCNGVACSISSIICLS